MTFFKIVQIIFEKNLTFTTFFFETYIIKKKSEPPGQDFSAWKIKKNYQKLYEKLYVVLIFILTKEDLVYKFFNFFSESFFGCSKPWTKPVK